MSNILFEVGWLSYCLKNRFGEMINSRCLFYKEMMIKRTLSIILHCVDTLLSFQYNRKKFKIRTNYLKVGSDLISIWEGIIWWCESLINDSSIRILHSTNVREDVRKNLRSWWRWKIWEKQIFFHKLCILENFPQNELTFLP